MNLHISFYFQRIVQIVIKDGFRITKYIKFPYILLQLPICKIFNILIKFLQLDNQDIYYQIKL